jgi:hypothetical protein
MEIQAFDPSESSEFVSKPGSGATLIVWKRTMP